MKLIRNRKLTQNQARRIDKQNSDFDDSRLHTGVIISHFGKQLDVLASERHNDDITLGQIYRCHARTNLPPLATNDTVQFTYNALTHLGRIEKLNRRHNLITRPDRYHKLKPVVANVDLLVVVFASLPKTATNLIDRYLLIAALNDIDVLLVLNKSDIIDAPSEQIYQEYQALNIDILKTNIHDDITHLTHKLHGKISIFAGQSGVGKSSLINQILPHVHQDTQNISLGSNLGQHTTTTSRLMPYDMMDINKGGIIDTPGIREYGIWHLHKDDIIQGFPELIPFSGSCQFRDCTHAANAKGCALWQAVKQGQVLARRVESLTALQAQAKQG